MKSLARRGFSLSKSSAAAVLALLVEVCRLAATLGWFLALLVVTPLAFVAFNAGVSALPSGAHREVPAR